MKGFSIPYSNLYSHDPVNVTRKKFIIIIYHNRAPFSERGLSFLAHSLGRNGKTGTRCTGVAIRGTRDKFPVFIKSRAFGAPDYLYHSFLTV